MSRILVTGATGTVGAEVVRALRERGAHVRAYARDAGRARERLGDDVEIAVGDLGDPVALARALRGADRAFLACGNVPGQLELEAGAIDALRAAGVRRVVKLSALGAAVGSPVAFWDWHGRIERHLADAGLAATVLRPNMYMTAPLAGAAAIAATGCLFAPADGARIAMVDPRDVAAVAAVALTEGGHDGAAYAVSGPAAITHDEVAAALADASGRPVRFVDVPEQAARQGMVESGLPGPIADAVLAVFAAMRAGAGEQVTDTVARLTGRPPRSFAQFAREHGAGLRAGAASGDPAATPA